MTKRVAILGSTGSIGRQTLDVIREHPEHFTVVGLAAGNNIDLLTKQVREFAPLAVSTQTPSSSLAAECSLVRNGKEGLVEIATMDDADIVVVATTGHNAIRPTLAAVRASKEIALANKEVVVCAGEVLMRTARTHGVQIRPVDSEHSAIWQCLLGRQRNDPVSRITLTASGGALRDFEIDDLDSVSAEQALSHPNWTMGPKVTIDSASLMNKGLEVIEAHWLFDTPYANIEVVIHPQSVVHSLVTFADGSTIAQLGIPDMRVPIQYALSYPYRLESPGRHLEITNLGRLDFHRPDPARYPALELAFQAGQSGRTYPTVLSAVDEIAVDAFLRNEIRFGQIVELVSSVLDRHEPASGDLTIEMIESADQWARARARELIQSGLT